MDKSYENKLKSILGNIDSEKLNQSKKALNNFLNSNEGKDFAKKMSGIDKDKLMKQFSQMSGEDIKNKLNNFDLSKLSKNDLNNILGYMKGFNGDKNE